MCTTEKINLLVYYPCGESQSATGVLLLEQEAQLMRTNVCDTFRGQSRSPNIVPLDMLGILFSCAIVTLSLRHAIFLIIIIIIIIIGFLSRLRS